MIAFPIDRAHPPSKVLYRDATRALELRPWQPSDVDALLEAIDTSAAELKPFMPWAHLPRDRASQYAVCTQFRASYFVGTEYIFGLFSETGEILGCAGLHPRAPLNPRALEVGYWCNSPHAGQGWVTLAVRILAALSFHRFNCDRFQVMHDEANLASQRVVEKCGFIYEGTLRNAVAEAAPERRAAGYQGTARNRLYSIVPSDLATLEWFTSVTAATQLIDALGFEQPLAPG